jgi:hypothetical protein
LKTAQEEFENKLREAQAKHMQELIANQNLKEKQAELAAKIAKEQKDKEEKDKASAAQQLAAKKV